MGCNPTADQGEDAARFVPSSKHFKLAIDFVFIILLRFTT
jgi:hypothetical protein